MTDIFWLGRDFDETADTPINFIETRLHDFSPFSAHEVELGGVVYKTAEHAYHALRTASPYRERAIEASSPMNAWRVAQEAKRAGALIEHDKDVLMEKIFRAKLAQHDDIREVLKCTGNRPLLKVFDADYYWGTGVDDSGENRMGKLWMKLRTELNNN